MKRGIKMVGSLIKILENIARAIIEIVF